MLRHGGHNNLFRDREGNLWTTLFGSGGENLIAINPGMVQLDMDDDGRILPLRGDARAFNIFATNQYNTVKWKYTFTSPASDWFQKKYKDALWAEGNGGFGNAPIVRKTYISPNRTIWNTHDIWLRKTFNAGNITPEEIDKMLLFINHDDGADVYINGIFIANYPGAISQYHISKISDEAKKSIIPNGDNVIAIHAWNNNGAQFIDAGIISWKGSIYTYSKRSNGNGLLGHYFNGLNFNTKAHQRIDKYINFNWAQSPDASVKTDSFSVRWTGQIEPMYSEKYTFYVNSNNGVRLWINGQKLIDSWRSQTPNEFSASISLQAGKKQDIILEYFNVKDIAKIKLEWESASQYRRVVPQSQLFAVDVNSEFK